MKRYAAKGCWPTGAGMEVVNDRKVWCSVKNRPERCRPAVGERPLAGWSEMYGVTVLPACAG